MKRVSVRSSAYRTHAGEAVVLLVALLDSAICHDLE